MPTTPADEAALVTDIIELVRQFGRFGYRRITRMLRTAGWAVNHKRVERIWRREGLKVPGKQRKRGRLWLNDGSCIRLRPEWANHVWSYDFVADRTYDGKAYRMLCIIDEFTRECLAIKVARRLNAIDVISALCDLFIARSAAATNSGPLSDRMCSGTPRAMNRSQRAETIVRKLSAEIAKIIRMPDINEQLSSQGAEPIGSTPEEFGQYMKGETEKWAKIVKASGIKLE